jgi:CBS domain-containing protein
MLTVDGRPAGFDAFEVPFQLIRESGDGEVRLTQAVDVKTSTGDSVPHFIAAPAAAASASSTPTTTKATTVSSATVRREPRQESARTTSAPSPVRTATTAATPAAVAQASRTAPTAAGVATTAPVSSTTYTAPTGTAANPQAATNQWIQHDWGTEPTNDGWSIGRVITGALTVGGLAAATYLMRRRNRRKTRTERLVEALTHGYGTASDFARDRNPAWWLSLAAAALPAAYYAWPSSQPTTGQRVGDRLDAVSDGFGGYTTALGGYAAALSSRVPSTDDLTTSLHDAWRRNVPSDWTVSARPDLALTGGLLAASALAFYLARRGTKPAAKRTRIADVMTRQPRVVQPDATGADAALMMRRLDIGALPVCDGSRLIGMLTDRDITLRSTADGRDPHLTPVRDIMTPGVAWASEDDMVEEAARIMREHRIRRLPIVDERHSLVGVVSLGDLAVDLQDNKLSGETLETISEPSQPDR